MPGPGPVGLSPRTVHDYVKELHEWLGVTSLGELVAAGRRPRFRPEPGYAPAAEGNRREMRPMRR